MRMRAGPGKSWPRRATPRSGCSLVRAQIRMLDCCSHMSFHLWPLRSTACCHDNGPYHFLRPAAKATDRTALSCMRFSDQNVYLTSQSMWETSTSSNGSVLFLSLRMVRITMIVFRRAVFSFTFSHPQVNWLMFEREVLVDPVIDGKPTVELLNGPLSQEVRQV